MSNCDSVAHAIEETNMIQPAVDFTYTLVPGSVKRAMKQAEAPSRDLWQVPPDQVRLIPGFNARVKNDEYRAHIRSLADSMKSEGFKQHKPLAGYVAAEDGQDVIYLYDGHCRYEGALLAISEGAEINRLPVVVSQSGANLEDLTVELVRSNEGKPLAPIEKAVVCKRLAGYGWEPAEIARRLGFTAQYVADLLLLVAAPAEIRDMVTNNEVSASVAIQTMKDAGSKAVTKLSEAKVRAAAAGKSKITKKHVSSTSEFDKVARASASSMATALLQLVDESGYACLSEERRAEIDAIVDKLKAAKGDAL